MSSSRRPAVLMGILLILLSGYLAQSHFNGQLTASRALPARLAGQNSVSKFKVQQDKAGLWVADFDYFYTGEPRACVLQIELLPHVESANDSAGFPRPNITIAMAQRGTHHISAQIPYPGSEQTTRQVAVTFTELLARRVLATQQIDQIIEWRARPDTPVGYEDMPVALIPVTEGNIEGIRLMREFGVDYSKLRYRGATAFDFAKQMGNSAMLEALGHASTTL